jgi:hypothetical protein
MLFRRLERFRDEESPDFTPFIPDESEDKEPTPHEVMATEEALSALRAWRRKQISIIESFGEAVWTKRALHPEFELYTPSILVRHIAMHDHWHMYRMEELWITNDEFLTDVQ